MNRRPIPWTGALIVVAMAAGPAAGQRLPDARRSQKHLFIEPGLVHRTEGPIRQVFHQPVKAEHAVIVPDRAWEDGGVPSILGGPVWSAERSLWQLWYSGDADALLPLYAESADGIQWDKPELGLVSWNGSTANNIIDLGYPAYGKTNAISVIEDPSERDPARRFKGVTRVNGRLRLLESPDGLTWRAVGWGPPTLDSFGLVYDPIGTRYLATLKTHEQPTGRAVSLSTSQDFRDWSEPRPLFAANERDQQLGTAYIERVRADPDRLHPTYADDGRYTTDVYRLPLFDYEGLYLGLPLMFNKSGSWPSGAEDGIIYPRLVVSHDLQEWNRLTGTPFISPSPISQTERWDYGMTEAFPPARREHELWFYYVGLRYTHGGRLEAERPKSAIFIARLRLDGFASLRASETPGVVITMPVEISGSSLCLNVDARGGEVQVGLRDTVTDRAISGYTTTDQLAPVQTDSVGTAVAWPSDLTGLLGRRVRLTFHLRQADLYAFWFSDHGCR